MNTTEVLVSSGTCFTSNPLFGNVPASHPWTIDVTGSVLYPSPLVPDRVMVPSAVPAGFPPVQLPAAPAEFHVTSPVSKGSPGRTTPKVALAVPDVSLESRNRCSEALLTTAVGGRAGSNTVRPRRFSVLLIRPTRI